MPIELVAAVESFPIAGEFRISRGAKREAVVVVATLRDGTAVGRGECTPYARYGETPDGVLSTIRAVAPAIATGLDRSGLREIMPPGAARNALDCALWDLEAKRTGRGAAAIAGLPALRPLLTATTLSLASPAQMADDARARAAFPLLKLKLAGDDDAERMRAVRDARPDARLVADANEAWSEAELPALLAAAAAARIELIEQPLPAGRDDALAATPHPVPICADESAHGLDSLAALLGRYDAINIKLDKTGGLTEALQLEREARRHGLRVMAGCMVATSLAMAPALLLAQTADWVDLDGPLILAADRIPGLAYDGPLVAPAPPAVWG